MHNDLKSDNPKNQNIDILPMLDGSFETNISMDENFKPDDQSYDLAEELMHRQELEKRQAFGELYRKTVKTEDDKKLFDQTLQQYAGEASCDPLKTALDAVIFARVAKHIAEYREERNKQMAEDREERNKRYEKLAQEIAEYREECNKEIAEDRKGLDKKRFHLLVGSVSGTLIFHIARYYKITTLSKNQDLAISMLIGVAISLSTYHLSNYLKRNTQPQEQKKNVSDDKSKCSQLQKDAQQPRHVKQQVSEQPERMQHWFSSLVAPNITQYGRPFYLRNNCNEKFYNVYAIIKSNQSRIMRQHLSNYLRDKMQPHVKQPEQVQNTKSNLYSFLMAWIQYGRPPYLHNNCNEKFYNLDANIKSNQSRAMSQVHTLKPSNIWFPHSSNDRIAILGNASHSALIKGFVFASSAAMPKNIGISLGMESNNSQGYSR